MLGRKLVLIAMLAGASGPVWSAPASPQVDDPISGIESIDSFRLFGQANGWQALDKRTLIVQTSPSRSYLITLKRPSNDLRFAQAIGLTSTGGRVFARFDQVIVDGWRYPIESIHALDRDEAKALASAKRSS